mmetsp:Transcript_20523/g.49353  ORF Transcript_20523/g.49353 Transcript_20523/m.49353 type:complete len:159 (+) Transcript_20523:163-639(+)
MLALRILRVSCPKIGSSRPCHSDEQDDRVKPHLQFAPDFRFLKGQDFLGWQEDTLTEADAVVNLVGGFTQQREMAAERIVRESLRVNPLALQITVGPKDDELEMISPGAYTTKVARLKQCEDLVSFNCANFECLRLEANRVEEECERIKELIYDQLKK